MHVCLKTPLRETLSFQWALVLIIRSEANVKFIKNSRNFNVEKKSKHDQENILKKRRNLILKKILCKQRTFTKSNGQRLYVRVFLRKFIDHTNKYVRTIENGTL